MSMTFTDNMQNFNPVNKQIVNKWLYKQHTYFFCNPLQGTKKLLIYAVCTKITTFYVKIYLVLSETYQNKLIIMTNLHVVKCNQRRLCAATYYCYGMVLDAVITCVTFFHYTECYEEINLAQYHVVHSSTVFECLKCLYSTSKFFYLIIDFELSTLSRQVQGKYFI